MQEGVQVLDSRDMVEVLTSFQVAKKGSGTLLKLRHSWFEDSNHYAECSSRRAYYLTNLRSVVDHGVDLRSKHDW